MTNFSRLSERTYFITFEGIDGCGKDTQMHVLAEAIRTDSKPPFGNKYHRVVLDSEPTVLCPEGIEIIRLMHEHISYTAEEAADLFIRDRLNHCPLIAQELKLAHCLLSRFDLSTLMYQTTHGMDFWTLYDMHKFEEGRCLIPDLTIVLDIPPEVALERKRKQRTKKEAYEELEFQKRLHGNQRYCIDELRKKERDILIVNGNQSIEDVTHEMLEGISDFVKTTEGVSQ